MTAIPASPGTTHPGFSASFASGRTRATATQVLLALMIGLSLLSATHSFAGFDLVREAMRGSLTIAEADAYDATTQTYAVAYLIFYFATAIAFLMWLSRSVDNIPQLTGELPSTTPRWSIGWWFVPVANLFKPFQVVRDLYRRMTEGRGNAIVLTWWLVWIGGGVLATIFFRMAEPTSIDQLNAWFAINLLCDLSTAVAGLLALLIVRRTQRGADAMAEGLGHLRSGLNAAAPLATCPRCGTPRVAGQQFCEVCRLDLWAEYDRAAEHPSTAGPSA